jgi:hypothetical protein
MKSNARFTCVAIASLFCVFPAGVGLGQTPPAKVDRPDIKVGDSWTYNRIDGNTKVKEFSTVVSVTAVDDKGIQLESKRTDTGAVETTVRNKDFNKLTTNLPPRKTTFGPYHPEFSFPLEVGKTWEQTVTTTRSDQADWKTTAPLKAKIVGWERVTVPAGTFNALKIEINGLYDGLDPRGRWNGTIAETIWYVPELKGPAKWTYQDNIRGRGNFNDDIWELAAYKPAP